MTENVNEHTAQQSIPSPPQFTPEQFAQIKISLKSQVQKCYTQFLTSIMQIPVEQKGLQEAIRFFDTGFIWFEKAVENLPINGVQMVTPSSLQNQVEEKPTENPPETL
jgi:hypothetical protein